MMDGKGSMKKDAKLCVLKELRKMASDMMGEDLKGMKKVTVAAPDKASLKAGLEKAEEMMESEESPEMDEMEESEEESSEEMSADEIDAKIQELMEMKKKLSAE